ncbi:MAG: TRAP transporter large permease subunit, partial [Alphaproteobacteria bacterium]|nr:TRAP transporter large permease subunit [Alphaproteobacteria bacterium]
RASARLPPSAPALTTSSHRDPMKPSMGAAVRDHSNRVRDRSESLSAITGIRIFIEWIEISYIAVPLFLPVFAAAQVDMVWLATLICVNLQTSFLTPPFGWALFFLRGVAPPEVTTGDIYRGIIPFVGMQLLALVLCFMFPQLPLWLPKTIGW